MKFDMKHASYVGITQQQRQKTLFRTSNRKTRRIK